MDHERTISVRPGKVKNGKHAALFSLSNPLMVEMTLILTAGRDIGKPNSLINAER
jgi:hypothetical protein